MMPKKVDWETLHAESLAAVRTYMAAAIKEKTKAAEAELYRSLFETVFAPRPPISYTLVLEWRGWKLLEVIEDVALGSEFYRTLPNGKRGLFGKCEEFTTARGEQGYLYHCINED